MKEARPSLDRWLEEARSEPTAKYCGMYLFHSGTVRETAKAMAREGARNTEKVRGMRFSADREKVARAIEEARAQPGIYHVRVWLNEGELGLGDDIMLVLIGGDIRPHVLEALQRLVGFIKNECVVEQEICDA